MLQEVMSFARENATLKRSMRPSMDILKSNLSRDIVNLVSNQVVVRVISSHSLHYRNAIWRMRKPRRSSGYEGKILQTCPESIRGRQYRRVLYLAGLAVLAEPMLMLVLRLSLVDRECS